MRLRLALAALLAFVAPAGAESTFPWTATALVNVRDFGGVADYTSAMGYGTSNTAAYSAALSASNGRCLYFPGGKYYFATTPNTATNTSLCIRGDGSEQTMLVFGGTSTDGIVANQDNFTHPVSIKGVTIATLGNETGAAISASWSDADATLNSDAKRLVIDDVSIRGEGNESRGWQYCIKGHNAQWADIGNGICTGRVSANTMAGHHNQLAGIYLDNGAYDIGVGYVHNFRIYSVNICIWVHGNPGSGSYGAPQVGYSGMMEGLNVAQFDCVNAAQGINWDVAMPSPGLSVVNGHMNVSQCGICGIGAAQAIISNLLVYKDPLTTATTTKAVDLSSSDHVNISDLTAINQTSDYSVAGAWVGVSLADSAYGKLSQITIERPSTGVSLSGTTRYTTGRHVRTLGSFTNGSTVAVSDTSSGPNNTIGGGPLFLAATNASGVTTTSGGAACGSLPSLTVFAGEMFRVSGQSQVTNGGTAGDILSTLYKASGTATIAVGSTGTQAIARAQIAANATMVVNVSGIITVTASGTMTISNLLQTTGSNGTASANACQLTIEQM